MKFLCTKENLVFALEVVSPLAGKHAHLPILNNVLIQVTDSKVEFITTNLEIAIKTAVRAKVDNAGSFTVPAKTLNDYVRLLPLEQAELEVVGNELILTCGTSSTKIKGSPADEYPVIPTVEEVHGYSVGAEKLKEMLSKTVIAVAKNEIRPELSGVYMKFLSERYDGLLLAATDSYRLAETRLPVIQGGDKDISCIVPSRVAYEIIRLITLARGAEAEEQVRLWISDNQIALRYSSFEMTSRLIQGKYPDYAQIIPANFATTATFPLDAVINKIKAASLFVTTGVNAVSFDLNVSEKTVGISSTSSQTGEHTSQLEADMSGQENSILLNYRYVQDGLQHMSSDKVTFKVNSADAPCLFSPAPTTAHPSEDYLYIVMPIRQ